MSDGRLEPGAHTAELAYRCALCAACNNACPSGLQVDHILLGLRSQLASHDLLPDALKRLQSAIAQKHNILGEEQQSRALWYEGDGMGDRINKQAEIVYFVGCVSALFPSGYALPQQTVRLMKASGLDFTILGGEEWCCGYPLVLNGREDAVADIARNLVRHVQALGAKTLVTSCPSCYHAWKHIYPEIVPDMKLEVLHVSELLVRQIREGRLKLQQVPPMTVTFHDSCDLGRRSKVYEPPRELIQAIPGIKLVEMRDNRANALCCGGGGNMESAAPKLVEEASARRLQQAVETGATAVVTACPQCRRTLTGAARRGKVRMRVMDLAELLAKAVPE